MHIVIPNYDCLNIQKFIDAIFLVVWSLSISIRQSPWANTPTSLCLVVALIFLHTVGQVSLHSTDLTFNPAVP